MYVESIIVVTVPILRALVDDTVGDEERVTGAQPERRPVVELHQNVATDDVADLDTGMTVPPRLLVPGNLHERLNGFPALGR